MRHRTAYNHRERAIRRLADAFSWLQISGMSSEELTRRYIEVKGTLGKCPVWVKAYVDGWYYATKASYERHLVFFYTMPDGSLVSTHRDRSDYYEKLSIGPREVYEQATHSGRYWVRDRYDHEKKRRVEVLVPYFVTEDKKP